VAIDLEVTSKPAGLAWGISASLAKFAVLLREKLTFAEGGNRARRRAPIESVANVELNCPALAPRLYRPGDSRR